MRSPPVGDVLGCITYLAPVVAVVAGVLLLSEPVTTRTIVGTLLVLAGAALAARRPPAADPV
ncbi:EamA family transporter [Nonomuraea mesophila]|uniref:EamA family transporter n=1 Tax=Nonomuraea mesophila TaxID=2530382 RepID=UPI001FEC02C7|nr:EamA family transporter [Nonomuraea mesophila]